MGVYSGLVNAIALCDTVNVQNNDIVNLKTLDFQQEFSNGSSGSGTVTINWTVGARQSVTLTGTPTFAFTNP